VQLYLILLLPTDLCFVFNIDDLLSNYYSILVIGFTFFQQSIYKKTTGTKNNDGKYYKKKEIINLTKKKKEEIMNTKQGRFELET
jgi:hypothetical protein